MRCLISGGDMHAVMVEPDPRSGMESFNAVHSVAVIAETPKGALPSTLGAQSARCNRPDDVCDDGAGPARKRRNPV